MDATQEIIREIVRDTNLYLDDLQRADRLWNELESHLLTSYLAEDMGQSSLVPRHLAAVTELLLEINDQRNATDSHLPDWTRLPTPPRRSNWPDLPDTSRLADAA